MILLRQELGDELRQRRINQGRTLRQVSSQARVSLGYLSEVERGQKEASSELLAAICTALDVPLSELLDGAAARVRHLEPARAVAAAETAEAPDAPVQPPALTVAGAVARTRAPRDTRPPRGTVAAA